MSNDILKRAQKLEKRGQLRKLKKVSPLIILLTILILAFLPGKSESVSAEVVSPPSMNSNTKHTEFTAKLKNREIVTVKSREYLELSSGDKIKLNRTTSILFNIKRYSFYSKIFY